MAERGDPGTESGLRGIVRELGRGEAVRRDLPGGGLLRIDRSLPYLFVHRVRGGTGSPTPRLLSGGASYLLWAGGEADEPALHAMVRAIAGAGAADHGAFLVLELWAAAEGARFRIRCPGREGHGTVRALAKGLAAMREIHGDLEVVTEPGDDRAPPGAEPLLDITECYGMGCLLLGLELPPVYLQPGAAARAYPVFYRQFRERLARALQQAVFDFLRIQTTAHVASYRMLGPRTIDAAAWRADRSLATIGDSFDFLMLISPINEDAAWAAFRDGGFEHTPDFQYRLLPVDPDLLKRRIYALPLEEIEDPSILYLLAERREELDKQISMLAERGAAAFLYSSIRLYRRVDEGLRVEAEEILHALPPDPPPRPGDGVDAAAFARRAAAEIARYRAGMPGFTPVIQIRPDVSGLMVSRGNLLIGATTRIDAGRVEALVQHEIGTHVLTYFNGGAQPLRQLACGLADYDEFQEGLGILAEYLAGGLTSARLRVLAARVVAAAAVEDGAGFLETFRLLRHTHGMTPADAFDVAARSLHGGGLTRDLIYLRGFLALLDHLRQGGELEPLYIGKIAGKHIPIMEELRERGVLRTPPLRPLFLEGDPAVAGRLASLRHPGPVTALVQETAA